MRARRLLTALVLMGAAVSAVPIAFAAGKAGGKDTSSSKGANAFNDAVNQGMQKYVSKDIPGAVELLRKATQLQPRNPLGYYLLGEAQLGGGSLSDAEAAWLQAEQVADNGPPGVKAKILFVMADLRERQGRWDDAKTAWKRYEDFAAQHADAGVFPESAATRIKDIEAMQKQDKDYVIVRKRIREEDGGTIQGAKMPPPEKP